VCGRFALAETGERLAAEFGAPVPGGLVARYNIAPRQAVWAVRAAPGGGRQFARLRWGLVPRWAADPSLGDRLINARAETLARRPAFSEAYRRRRCLVPATAFYEWERTAGRKRPWCIRRRDGRPLALAALWERWEPPGGAPVESCAIVTTEANDLVRPVHGRMPAVLAPAAWDLWLDPAAGPGDLAALLSPCPSEELEIYPVSPAVNDPRRDDPGLLAPLS